MSRRQILVFIGFVMSLGLIAQNASAQAIVFDCQKRMDISGDPAAPEWIEFGITVVETAQVGGVSSVLDAAGVRAIEFSDVNGLAITKGMFFGWAGPHICD